MLFLLNNTILILCNLAPEHFPLCQVWLKTSPEGEGKAYVPPPEGEGKAYVPPPSRGR
jgi:hypothetical protein